MSDQTGGRVVAIIPTRGGSEGIPNKNLKLLGGRPLLWYTVQAAVNALSVDQVVISTDSDEVAEYGGRLGAEIMRHPPELSGSEAPSFHTIRWAVEELDRAGTVDLVAVLRATTPFRSFEDIDAAVARLRGRPDADSLVSVSRLEGVHPRRLRTVDRHGVLIDAFEQEGHYPVRRQELEQVFIRNGGIYLARPRTIMMGRLWGDRCLAYEMSPAKSLNLNSAFDFELAELIANHGAAFLQLT